MTDETTSRDLWRKMSWTWWLYFVFCFWRR